MVLNRLYLLLLLSYHAQNDLQLECTGDYDSIIIIQTSRGERQSTKQYASHSGDPEVFVEFNDIIQDTPLYFSVISR